MTNTTTYLVTMTDTTTERPWMRAEHVVSTEGYDERTQLIVVTRDPGALETALEADDSVSQYDSGWSRVETNVTEIHYETDRDCGCEISNEQFQGFLASVHVALSKAYDGARIIVMERTLGTKAWSNSDDVDESEIRAIAQDVWNEGSFWEAE
jgi:hypothetical protein